MNEPDGFGTHAPAGADVAHAVSRPWWQRRSSAGIPEKLWPPGVREEDLRILQAPAILLFDPSRHAGPQSLAEAGDLFAPLDYRPELSDSAARHERPGDEDIDDEGRIDLLAWYSTFRLREPWGIYIREHGIQRIACKLNRPGRDSGRDLRQAAATFLYLHEYAHFLFDVATSALERAVGAELYEPHRREIRWGQPGWHLVEESLCNAFAYQRVSLGSRKQALRRYLRRGPIGYRDFESYLGTPNFNAGVEAFLGEVLHGSGGEGPGLRALFADTGKPPVGPSMVPVYLVTETSAPPIFALITSIGVPVPSRRFSKELAHLPPRVQVQWTDDVLPALRIDVRQTSEFKRLRGERDLFSVRVAGQYRVILRRGRDGWSAEHIGHRRDVYKGR